MTAMVVNTSTTAVPKSATATASATTEMDDSDGPKCVPVVDCSETAAQEKGEE